MNKYKHFRLSKVVSRENGEKAEKKEIVGRNYTFHTDYLKVGNRLDFKDVNHVFGFHDEGEIVSIRKEVIRKRDYTVITTNEFDYYLLEHKAQG